MEITLLSSLHSLGFEGLESVWDDEEQFDDVARCGFQVARNLLLECDTKKLKNSLLEAGYGGWLLYIAASVGDLTFVQKLHERKSAFGVWRRVYDANGRKGVVSESIWILLPWESNLAVLGELFKVSLVHRQRPDHTEFELLERISRIRHLSKLTGSHLDQYFPMSL